MSAAPLLDDAVVEPVSDAARIRPSLSLIPGGAARMGRTTFGVVVGALLGAGLIAVLLLNTVLAQGAFAIHELEQQSARLLVTQQRLEQEVAALDAPGSLEQRARELGMVSMRSPVFLRLRDGKVLGQAAAAESADRGGRAAAAAAGASAAGTQAPSVSKPAAPAARKPSAEPAPSGDGAVAVSRASDGTSDSAEPVTGATR